MSNPDPRLTLFQGQFQDIVFNDRLPGVDTIRLAGEVMYGQWVLEPGSVKFANQVQQGYGLDGAAIRNIGMQIAHPSFIVRFWNASDWASFQTQRRQYLSKAVNSLAGFQKFALGIAHPELNAVGITAVCPEEVPWFTNNGKGLWTGRVQFVQYRPPVIAPESVDATIPAVSAPASTAQQNAAAAEAQHINETNGARG